MKNLSIFRLVTMIIITLLLLSGIVVAESVQDVEIDFAATEAADGMVDLDMTVKNATFMGVQVAVRYNRDVLEPVDAEGNKVTDFSGFAERPDESKCFNSIGLLLDEEKGLFGFTYFIMPGTSGSNINDNDEYVADEDGVHLYKFRFKKLEDADYSFEIATEDEEKPYQASLKDGLIISNYTEKLKAKVIFTYNDKAPEQTVIVPSSGGGGGGGIIVPQMTADQRKKDVIMLKIGANFAIAHGTKKAIDPDNNQVVPYLKNDRTLVPLRFIAETLGAEVLWEEGWEHCIIKKGGTEIKITFGSAEFTVNGETVKYDAPIEVVHDRTMVPVRFVSETLACDVYWNEKNEAVVISPLDNPWNEKRLAESTALGEMLVTLLPMMP